MNEGGGPAGPPPSAVVPVSIKNLVLCGRCRFSASAQSTPIHKSPR